MKKVFLVLATVATLVSCQKENIECQYHISCWEVESIDQYPNWNDPLVYDYIYRGTDECGNTRSHSDKLDMVKDTVWSSDGTIQQVHTVPAEPTYQIGETHCD